MGSPPQRNEEVCILLHPYGGSLDQFRDSRWGRGRGNEAPEADGDGGLVIWGHTRLAESLMRSGLIDVLDLSIHPKFIGAGEPLLREGLGIELRLLSTKSFSNIVKISYEPHSV